MQKISEILNNGKDDSSPSFTPYCLGDQQLIEGLK
jgi:hypothetical protein